MKSLALRCTLLLISLVWIGGGGANAQTLDAPALARIAVTDAALPNLPVYAQLRDAAGNDYVLVIASLARLQAVNMAYRVLDTNAVAAEYLLARERRPGARAAAAQHVTILHDDGKQIVARATPAQADALSALGLALQRLDAPLIVRPPTQRIAATSATAIPDPTIATMIAQVQSSTATDYVRRLSGETPVTIGGAPYTIATRHTTTSGGVPSQYATQYVSEFLQARGLSVSYHNWNACGISGRNVIGQKTGAQVPNEIVLVVAHLDDMPSGALAPGADDNASGSVGVMLAAEILTPYAFRRTLRFVFFTGEEQGLCGSAAYASAVAGAGENIVAVYNMDMIAWDNTNGPTLRLHTRVTSHPSYAADLAIANLFVSVVNNYGLSGALSPIIAADSESYSDHASFWNRGYAAILAIEDDWNDFNAYYHSTNDRVAAINATYFTNYLKASIGTAAHLADYAAGTGTVQGSATDTATTLPLADATVQANVGSILIASGRTNGSGAYALTLPVGTYNLTAAAPRYVFQTLSSVTVISGTTVTRNFALPPASAILFVPRVAKFGN